MHITIYQCYKTLQKKEGYCSTEHVQLVQSVESFKFIENPILKPHQTEPKFGPYKYTSPGSSAPN